MAAIMPMYEFDSRFRDIGFKAVCGVDEAGRGPLAGAVFAAAVVLPPDMRIEGLNDSKKLTEKAREKIFSIIIQKAVTYSVQSATVAEIEQYNILGASLLAMRRAVEAIQTDCALIDGNRDPRLNIETALVVKGDSKSASIAAASILAKVSRDRYMLELEEKYPQFGFAKHKGYPTKLHYEMLDKYGPTPEHRQHFLRKWRQLANNGQM